MHWIIDGMNVVGSRPDGWWRDRPAARRRLVADLAALGAPGDRVTVVFDGRWHRDEVEEGERTGIAVAFAPGGPDAADHVIAGMAEALENPVGATVVTSDAGLAGRVRAVGVEVIGVTELRRRLDR